MRGNRRLRAGAVAATLLLGTVTVGLASVPPRPLRSALAVVYTLTVRVATDWLVVVALLAVADRYARTGRVDRATVRRLAALVALGGLAVEASPFVRLVVDPAPVGTERLVRGLVTAVQGTLFPTGLFVATVTGAATLREAAAEDGEFRHRLALRDGNGEPALPSVDPVSVLAAEAARRVVAVVAAVAGVAFVLEAGVRVALGAPHFWLAVLDAAVGALGGLVDYAVLAVAFLALAAAGARVRSVVGGAVGVWAAVFLLSFAVATLGAVLAVGLVGVTTTTMAAVESSTLGEWPAPHSWRVVLRPATFVAAGVGLLTVQRAGDRVGPRGADVETDPGAEAGANGPQVE